MLKKHVVKGKTIRLTEEWLGHRPGKVLTLIESKADDLVARGQAELVDDTKPKTKQQKVVKDRAVRAAAVETK